MEYGIAVATSTDSWKVVKRAEQLGFVDSWFYDTQLLNPDVFVSMALTAVNTSRINIGTGVLIPSNRIAPVAANALASINKLAPGRVKFGVGTGFTGRRTMGQTAMKLRDMRDYINDVQGLLKGDIVNWQSEGKTHAIKFLNPDLGLINLDDEIPLYVSAFGEKSRKLVADLGAGWLTFGGSVEEASDAIQDMQSSWSNCEHQAEDLHSTFFTLGCVLAAGESATSERSIAQAGPLAAVGYHALVEGFAAEMIESVFPPERAAQIEAYREIYNQYTPQNAKYLQLHRGHLMFTRPEEKPFITEELILGSTFTGSKEKLVDDIRQLEAAGYQQFTIQVVEGQEQAIEDWADVFAAV